MKEQLWTVVRWPNGSLSTGGRPDSPDYEDCWVDQILAISREKAKSKAQSKYSRQHKSKAKA